MRLFNCLSQNSSMIVEKQPKTWKERLNFRSKKRRSGPYESNQPFTPCGKKVRFDKENQENQPPMEVCAEVYSSPGLSSDLQNRLSIQTTPRSSWSVRRAARNAHSPVNTRSARYTSATACRSTRVSNDPLPPLPALPAHAPSILIKELNNTQGECDSDYLPLSEVCSPLVEDNTSQVTVSPRRYASTCDTMSLVSGAYTRYDSSLCPESFSTSQLENIPEQSIVPYSIASESQFTDSQFTDSQLSDTQFQESQLTESKLTYSQLTDSQCTTADASAFDSQLTAQTCSQISVGDYGYLRNVKTKYDIDTTLPEDSQTSVMFATLPSSPTSQCSPVITCAPPMPSSHLPSVGSLFDKAFVTSAGSLPSTSSAGSLPSRDSGVSSYRPASPRSLPSPSPSSDSAMSRGTSTEHIYNNDSFTSASCTERVVEGATQHRSHFQEMSRGRHAQYASGLSPVSESQVSQFRRHVKPSHQPEDTIDEDSFDASVMNTTYLDTFDESDMNTTHLEDNAHDSTHIYANDRANEFHQDADGWYYLLTEDADSEKPLKAQPNPVLTPRTPRTSHTSHTSRTSHNIPTINAVVAGQDRIVVSHGFIV